MNLHELLSPVYETPWDLDLKRVIADRLVEMGHPYGEYIHASLNAEPMPPGPERLALEQHAESLLAPHRLEWAGDLAPAVQHKLLYREGVPWRADLDPNHLREVVGHPAWRTFGYCCMWPERYAWEPWETRDDDIEATLCSFADSDATAETLDILGGRLAPRMVRRLAKGRPKALTRVDVYGNDVPEFVNALAGPRPGLPRLRWVIFRMDLWSTNAIRMLMGASELTKIEKYVAVSYMAPEWVEMAIEVGSPVNFLFGAEPSNAIRLDGKGGGELSCPLGDDFEGLEPDLLRVLWNAPFTRFRLKLGEWSRTSYGQGAQRALFASIPKKEHRRPALSTHTVVMEGSFGPP